MYKKVSRSERVDFFLYTLTFFILLEWLLPLPHVTNTGFIHLFIVATALFFIITFFQPPYGLSYVLKAGVIAVGLHSMFFDSPLFSLEWVKLLLHDFRENFIYMFSGQWDALTDLFRSFLFFLLLAIMSDLLYYWTTYMQRITFFLLCTTVYVGVIDTFTIYDARYAIVRIVVISFLLLGLLSIYRRLQWENALYIPKYFFSRLALIMTLFIGIGSMLGFISPKLEPQWQDPVPFLKAVAGVDDMMSSIGHKKIGYGDDDEYLGGGFINDTTPLFYAAVEEKHYWRGETKDFYTGKGWKTTTPQLDDSLDAGENESERVFHAEVAFAEEADYTYDHLFYPGELVNGSDLIDVDLIVDYYSRKARIYSNGSPVSLSYYQLEYVNPTYDAADLRVATDDDPHSIVEYYTQLPSDVPSRVLNLAEEITAEYDNRYDQAKAIEAHLSSAAFTYETENVYIPEEDEDYVDQFLFESKQGYCDNFSTSMIVLLRSLDIPARWAKGFTYGDWVDSPSNDQHIYKITNGHAHSWVEVYFPGIGWVPFEPTKGFTNSVIQGEDNRAEESVIVEKDIEERDYVDVFTQTNDWKGTGLSKQLFSRERFMFGVGSIMFMVIVMVILIINRKRIARMYTLHRFSRKEDYHTFVLAYKHLLSLLSFMGYKRNDGETLREYALRMDHSFSTDRMVSLTAEYERIVYGHKNDRHSWDLHKENWLAFVREIGR